MSSISPVCRPWLSDSRETCDAKSQVFFLFFPQRFYATLGLITMKQNPHQIIKYQGFFFFVGSFQNVETRRIVNKRELEIKGMGYTPSPISTESLFEEANQRTLNDILGN